MVMWKIIKAEKLQEKWFCKQKGSQLGMSQCLVTKKKDLIFKSFYEKVSSVSDFLSNYQLFKWLDSCQKWLHFTSAFIRLNVKWLENKRENVLCWTQMHMLWDSTQLLKYLWTFFSNRSKFQRISDFLIYLKWIQSTKNTWSMRSVLCWISSTSPSTRWAVSRAVAVHKQQSWNQFIRDQVINFGVKTKRIHASDLFKKYRF